MVAVMEFDVGKVLPTYGLRGVVGRESFPAVMGHDVGKVLPTYWFYSIPRRSSR